MKVDQTKAFFEKILAVTTMGDDTIDPIAVWAAFKLLLYQQIDDCNEEGPASFLVDWGLMDGVGEKRVYLCFVRTFTILSGDEYLYTLETRCDLESHAGPGINELVSEGAPSNYDSLERGIFDIERRPTFRTLLRWPGPWKAEVYHQRQ